MVLPKILEKKKAKKEHELIKTLSVSIYSVTLYYLFTKLMIKYSMI